jgi:hypothetical protein
MDSQEEKKVKASQIEAMQNRNGIDNWPFPQPRGWVAQWDPDGLAHAIRKNETVSDKPSAEQEECPD